MERLFCTLIKKDHEKFGKNKYVRGRIHGFMTAICEDNPKQIYPMYPHEEGRILLTKCDPEKYKKFKELTELTYPGLCEFDREIDFKVK